MTTVGWDILSSARHPALKQRYFRTAPDFRRVDDFPLRILLSPFLLLERGLMGLPSWEPRSISVSLVLTKTNSGAFSGTAVNALEGLWKHIATRKLPLQTVTQHRVCA